MTMPDPEYVITEIQIQIRIVEANQLWILQIRTHNTEIMNKKQIIP
jgi:hypothetical protein